MFIDASLSERHAVIIQLLPRTLDRVDRHLRLVVDQMARPAAGWTRDGLLRGVFPASPGQHLRVTFRFMHFRHSKQTHLLSPRKKSAPGHGSSGLRSCCFPVSIKEDGPYAKIFHRTLHGPADTPTPSAGLARSAAPASAASASRPPMGPPFPDHRPASDGVPPTCTGPAYKVAGTTGFFPDGLA